MTVLSRTVVRLATAVAIACSSSLSSFALDYPVKPVRLIVGVAPEAQTTRSPGCWRRRFPSDLASQSLSNRPGAGGNVGLGFVANATPDGYTLLFATSSNALGAAIYGDANVDFARDITPVASLVTDR